MEKQALWNLNKEVDMSEDKAAVAVKPDEHKMTKRHKKTGRPLVFKNKMLKDAEILGSLGLTEEDLSTYWGVSPRSVTRWKQKNDRFCQAIKRGKLEANISVSRKLYELALGGNLGAAVFWLSNRAPESWKNGRAAVEAKAMLSEVTMSGAAPSTMRRMVDEWPAEKKQRFLSVVAKIEGEMGRDIVGEEITKEEIKSELKEEVKEPDENK